MSEGSQIKLQLSELREAHLVLVSGAGSVSKSLLCNQSISTNYCILCGLSLTQVELFESLSVVDDESKLRIP